MREEQEYVLRIILKQFLETQDVEQALEDIEGIMGLIQ